MTVFTKAQMQTEIATQLPNNTSGLITPAIMRTVLDDMVDSYLDAQGASTAAAHTALMGPTSGGAAVPSFRQPDATDATFTQSGAGATLRALSAKIFDYPISPEDFGAVGNGVTDDRVAVQAAINQAIASSRPLLLKSSYAVSQAGASPYCLIINSTIVIIGSGKTPVAAPTGGVPVGRIIPMGSVGATVNLILLQGTADNVATGTVIMGIGLGNATTPLGQHLLAIDTTNGFYIGNMVIAYNTFFYANGQAINHNNTAGDATGGWFTSLVFKNEIYTGIKTLNSGSANVISSNWFRGTMAALPWISWDGIAGSIGPIITDNLAEGDGSVKVDGGDMTLIMRNELEASSAGAGSNFAIIDINAGSRVIHGTTIKDNFINNAAAATLLYHVRLGANADQSRIGSNYWGSSNVQAGSRYVNNAGTLTFFDNLQFYGATALTGDKYITNTGTMQSRAMWGRTGVADTNYVVLPTDYVVSYTSISVARTVTLPFAKSYPPGRRLIIRDDSGSATAIITISIALQAGDTFQGGAGPTVIINQAQGCCELQSDGITSWLAPLQSGTGDVTFSTPMGAAMATTVAKIQTKTVSGTTGTTNVVFSTSPTISGPLVAALTFATLPAATAGTVAYITDGAAGNCADGTCTTFGTNVTGGGGALKLLIWRSNTNWTLIGK